MQACPAFDPLGPYVGSVVSYADCQTLTLGEAGYRALGAGSPFGMALTGLLTIYVALIGYRLLLGGEITIRNTMSVALRLGIVVALATQWSAYRALVFDVATKVPQELANSTLGQVGLNGQGIASLTERVDGARIVLEEIIQAQTEIAAGLALPPAQGQGQQAPPPAGQNPAQTGQAVSGLTQASLPTSAAIAVGTISITALAGLLSVRVPMALLLALGPIFIAFLLFDGTRGWFNSWARGLAGTVIGALAVPAVLALELAIIEPQVSALRDLVQAREPLGTLPLEILATTGVFALVMIAALAAAVRAALGFRLPSSWWSEGRLPGLFATPQAQPALALAGYRGGDLREDRSRARNVADAALALERRDLRVRQGEENNRNAAPSTGKLATERQWDEAAPIQRLGQMGRRADRRSSVGAARRDELT